MTRGAYMVLDQGTTNQKALVVDVNGKVLAAAQAPVDLHLPRPGWFEQDGEAMWTSAEGCLRRCLAQLSDTEILGVALSVQRESVIAWDATDTRAISPILGWQDSRTSELLDGLMTPENAERIRLVSGLRPSPMFSAPKILWLLEALQRQGIFTDSVRLGTLDAFLLAKLTGGRSCVTEVGCASRTLLMDVRRCEWSDELLSMFNLPRSVLPEIHASTVDLGVTRNGGPLPAGIPVRAVLGDSHAALYAQCGDGSGVVKATYGTGSSVMARVSGAAIAAPGVSTCVGWDFNGTAWAQEGNILATGAALDTMTHILGLPDVSALDRAASEAGVSTDLALVPAFSGLAAPHWDAHAVGVLVGLRRETTQAEVARAALESVAQQVCDVLDAMESTGTPVSELRADGGASRSGILMQIQADLTGVPCRVADTAELSAMGAVSLAMRADGRDGLGAAPASTVFEPQQSPGWREQRRTVWRDAVGRSRAADNH